MRSRLLLGQCGGCGGGGGGRLGIAWLKDVGGWDGGAGLFFFFFLLVAVGLVLIEPRWPVSLYHQWTSHGLLERRGAKL
jgi:hypothetical protein